MKTKLIAARFAIAMLATPLPLAAQANPVWKVWNVHSRFSLPAYDSGNQTDSCFIAAPWGPGSWGLEGSTFTDPLNHALEGSRFAIFPQKAEAYLYGKDSTGRWGSVRFRQGDVWGGSHCGSIPWHVPRPLRVRNRTIVLKLDYFPDLRNLLTANDSWVMPAINLWFSSPGFPAGGDKLGRKPLVLDLAVDHSCNIPGCGLRSFEDAAAFHYQRLVRYKKKYRDRARCRNRPGWRCYTIPLNGIIRTALSRQWELSGGIAHAASMLRLYQLDALIELHNAEGAASIDNVRIEYR